MGDFHNSEKEVYEKEISPDGKYIIYNYRIGGGAMADDIYGSRILEKGKLFSESDGFELHGGVANWISNDTLEVRRSEGEGLEQPKDTLEKISYEKFKDLNIKVITLGQSNGWGMIEYTFDSFSIQNNKICFTGIEHLFGPPMEPEKCFQLGNVTFENSKDSLTDIVVTRLIKSMDFKLLKPDKKTWIENLPEIKISYIHFHPKSYIHYSKDSIRGVFYSIK